jgi:hypothetical protein
MLIEQTLVETVNFLRHRTVIQSNAAVTSAPYELPIAVSHLVAQRLPAAEQNLRQLSSAFYLAGRRLRCLILRNCRALAS